jgi:hypothetical protein
LRGSAHKGSSSFDGVRSLAGGAIGRDHDGYRRAFLQLVDRARSLSG